MSLKTELKTVWREEMSHLSRLDSETQAWKIQMERINHIEKLLVDLEKSENENDEKVIPTNNIIITSSNINSISHNNICITREKKRGLVKTSNLVIYYQLF